MNEDEKIQIVRKRVLGRISQQQQNSNNFFKKTLKNKNVEELLGIDFIKYTNYLEDNFKKGMSFEKRNFHIDHVLPLSRSLSPQEYLSRWNYLNTKPELILVNTKKSSAYEHEIIVCKKLRKYYSYNSYTSYSKTQLQNYLFFVLGCIKPLIRIVENIVKKRYSINYSFSDTHQNINIKLNSEVNVNESYKLSLLFFKVQENIGIFPKPLTLKFFEFIEYPKTYINLRDNLINHQLDIPKLFNKLEKEFLILKEGNLSTVNVNSSKLQGKFKVLYRKEIINDREYKSIVKSIISLT